MRIRTFAHLAWAVVRLTLRDRVAAVFMLLLPVTIIGLIGTVLSATTSRPLGVVVEGHGQWSGRLLARLSADPAIKVTRYPSLTALQTAVRQQGVALGLDVPADFDAALDGGGAAVATFIVEREELVPAALRLAVGRDLNTVIGLGLATHDGVTLGHLPPPRAEQRAAAAGSAGTPVQRVQQTIQAAGGAQTGIAYSAPGNLVLFIFLNIVATGSGLVVVRQSGVARRMLSTASGPWVISLAEGAGRLALGMLQAMIIVLAGALVFHVRWGPPAGVALIAALAATISAALALITSALSATPQQAYVLAPAVMLTAAMLGGCLWPLSIVSAPLRVAGRFFPLAWAMDAFLRLGATGAAGKEVMTDAGVLAAFAVLAVLVAVPVYRRRIALS